MDINVHGPFQGFRIAAGIGAFFRRFTKWALDMVGPMMSKGLGTLGLGLVAQDFAITPMINEMQTALGGAPAAFMQVVGYVRADVAISMILSAYAVRAVGRVIFGKSE